MSKAPVVFFHMQQTPTLQKPALHQQSTKGDIPDPFQILKIYILFCHENEIAHL
jgi:hypothetical protein